MESAEMRNYTRSLQQMLKHFEIEKFIQHFLVVSIQICSFNSQMERCRAQNFVVKMD